jgi:broad-specificity NMP kinase
MTYKNVSVNVDVCLEDFDDEELIEELEERDYKVSKKDDNTNFDRINTLVYDVWLARVRQVPNLDEHLNELFNEVLNRSI